MGEQAALDMLLTGRRAPGQQAWVLGLCDEVVPEIELRQRAHDNALDWPVRHRSLSRPSATMRADLVDEVRGAFAHERQEQARMQATDDFREGIAGVTVRRRPHFTGR